jgi:hypothetical protein
MLTSDAASRYEDREMTIVILQGIQSISQVSIQLCSDPSCGSKQIHAERLVSHHSVHMSSREKVRSCTRVGLESAGAAGKPRGVSLLPGASIRTSHGSRSPACWPAAARALDSLNRERAHPRAQVLKLAATGCFCPQLVRLTTISPQPALMCQSHPHPGHHTTHLRSSELCWGYGELWPEWAPQSTPAQTSLDCCLLLPRSPSWHREAISSVSFGTAPLCWGAQAQVWALS